MSENVYDIFTEGNLIAKDVPEPNMRLIVREFVSGSLTQYNRITIERRIAIQPGEEIGNG